MPPMNATVMPRWGNIGRQRIEDDGPLTLFPNMTGRQRRQEGRKAKLLMILRQ